jgi:hypothetical protein
MNYGCSKLMLWMERILMKLTIIHKQHLILQCHIHPSSTPKVMIRDGRQPLNPISQIMSKLYTENANFTSLFFSSVTIIAALRVTLVVILYNFFFNLIQG